MQQLGHCSRKTLQKNWKFCKEKLRLIALNWLPMGLEDLWHIRQKDHRIRNVPCSDHLNCDAKIAGIFQLSRNTRQKQKTCFRDIYERMANLDHCQDGRKYRRWISCFCNIGASVNIDLERTFRNRSVAFCSRPVIYGQTESSLSWMFFLHVMMITLSRVNELTHPVPVGSCHSVHLPNGSPPKMNGNARWLAGLSIPWPREVLPKKCHDNELDLGSPDPCQMHWLLFHCHQIQDHPNKCNWN